MEYSNGIYQGDFDTAGDRDGMGVFIWDSGELYFGLHIENKNNRINIFFEIYFF